jgi:hypothetical protein
VWRWLLARKMSMRNRLQIPRPLVRTSQYIPGVVSRVSSLRCFEPGCWVFADPRFPITDIGYRFIHQTADPLTQFAVEQSVRSYTSTGSFAILTLPLL